MYRLLLSLFVADLILALASWIVGSNSALITSQIAFFSSLAIVLASFNSYKKMVKSRLESNSLALDERDNIDKLEDPYRVWEEDESKIKEEDIAKVIKEEKKYLKQNRRSLTQVAKDSAPAFSIFRLLAYLALFLGFIFLKNSNYLNIPIYLLSLAIPIIVTVWVLLGRENGL